MARRASDGDCRPQEAPTAHDDVVRAGIADHHAGHVVGRADPEVAFGVVEELALAAASLDALSPLGVLQRGYAIAQDASGKLVRDASSVSLGDAVTVRLAKGKLGTRIERIEATD